MGQTSKSDKKKLVFLVSSHYLGVFVVDQDSII